MIYIKKINLFASTTLFVFFALGLFGCKEVDSISTDTNKSEESSCGQLSNGEIDTRVRYLAPTVPMGQSCQPQTQSRTCTNGEFSNFSPDDYTFTDCVVTTSSSSNRAPSALSIRQIFSGHSLTDDAAFSGTSPGHYARSIERLDSSVDILSTVGRSTIGGSPMIYRWGNSSGSPDARQDIADWDLLVITERVPFSLSGGTGPGTVWQSETLDYMRLWVEHAYQNGNNGQGAEVILYATWTYLYNEATWRAELDSYLPLWEQMADYGPANIPNSSPVHIIPANLLMMRLYDDIQNNDVPGVTSIRDFFRDNIHLNGLGSYAVALMHLAVIHHVNPNVVSATGLGLSPEPDAQLTEYLQTVVWEIARNYERAGVP